MMAMPTNTFTKGMMKLDYKTYVKADARVC